MTNIPKRLSDAARGSPGQDGTIPHKCNQAKARQGIAQPVCVFHALYMPLQRCPVLRTVEQPRLHIPAYVQLLFAGSGRASLHELHASEARVEGQEVGDLERGLP